MYITIPLADVKDHNIKLTSDKLSFTGSSNGKSYAVELDFVRINIICHHLYPFVPIAKSNFLSFLITSLRKSKLRDQSGMSFLNPFK